MANLAEITKSVETGNANAAAALTTAAVEEGENINGVLSALLAGMESVGERFSKNEIYIPQVLISARALNRGLDIVKPLIEASGANKDQAKAIICTVEGDLHDIGKNLVKMMFIGSGFDVIDLGVDVPAATIVETAIAENVQIIALSALLTTTMGKMKDVIDMLADKGVRDSVKVMVGGAPITQAFADEIGADAYSADAATAARIAKTFVV